MTTLEQPFKASYLLVTIRWAGKVYRYTNQSSPVKGYKSVPTMALEPTAMLGTLDPEVWTLQLPEDELSEKLLGRGSKSKAVVSITEVTLDGRLLNPRSSIKHSGTISISEDNTDGKQGWIKYSVSNDKQALKTRPGGLLLETCDNVLFGNGCEVLKENHTYTGTLISFFEQTRQAVITGFPIQDALLYFTFGNISREGSLVDIRFWTRVDPQVFHTAKLVPLDWIGKEVQLVAGCMRTLEVCRESFDNEENFNGIGRKTPNYNPQLETGGV